jgi:hypothetical protein
MTFKPPVAAGDTYHRVVFEHVEEAAAFVAALSRFASSPAGSSDDVLAAHESAIDVVAAMSVNAQYIDLYLNDAALAATIRGFGRPAVVDSCLASALPLSRFVLLAQNDRGAYGRDDIARRIANAMAGAG